MKKLTAVLLALVLLSGCAAVPGEVTEPLSQPSQPSLSETSAETSSETSAETSSGISAETPSVSLPEGAGLISLSSYTVRPGGYIVVTAQGAGGAFGFSDMFGVEREMTQTESGVYVCLVPVRASCEPGDYPLTIEGGGLSFYGVVTVEPRVFEQQTITFDDTVVAETINSKEANAEYYNKINALKYESVPEKLWEGGFVLPLRTKYTLSSSFGLLRTYIYTDGKKSDRHMGLDMAVTEGTPVYASNSGKVLFAGFLQLTGNTVLIEHGYGLKTWYYHMSEIYVSAGDMVEKERQIGAVGSTGFSTGPHLHFAASVNDINIDPEILLSAEPAL